MVAPVVYGISNCDTIKKARRWLDQHHIEYVYHDFRRDGLTTSQLKQWLHNSELDTLLNKHSRTWRELDEQSKTNVTEAKAIKLMLDQPSLIKRPVLSVGKKILVGFDNTQYELLFKK